MTKNGNSDDKRTVRVFGADGRLAGFTYPKRAAGLVKKGRAQFVNDCDIRLYASDVTHITEETTMDNNNISLSKTEPAQPLENHLFFNAREWRFNKDCSHNVGSRSFMQGPDGIIAEAYTIGDWGYNWTEIYALYQNLPQNTLHTFTFWLNGGENDRSDEVCRFEVIFDNDYENRYTFNLNRNYIPPIKRLNGWELYEIPFIVGRSESVELRFVAQRAYMTVIAAKEPSAYAAIPDTRDEFEEFRPQRHNIVFEDGWPKDTNYSTNRLRNTYGKNAAAPAVPPVPATPPMPAVPYTDNSEYTFGDVSDALNNVSNTLKSVSDEVSRLLNGAISAESIEKAIEKAVENLDDDADADDLVEDIIDEISDLLEELSDNISDIIEDMTDSLEDELSAIESQLEDLQD